MVEPTSGWVPLEMPFRDLFVADTPETRAQKVAWLRFPFEPSRYPGADIALSIEVTSERFTVFLDGKKIFRNYADPTSQNFGNFRPYIIPIPAEFTQTGQISIRIESEVFWCLALIGVRLGPDAEIRPHHEWLEFAQFLAPQLINAVIGTLTIATLLFWLMRPKEKVLLWLGAVGLVWFVRNTHYSLTRSPIDPFLMWEIVINSIFVLQYVFTGFGVTFFDLRNSRFVMIGASLILVFVTLLRYALIAFEMSDLPSFVLALPATVAIAGVFAYAARKSPRPEIIMMLVTVVLAFLSAYHDLAYLLGIVQGAGFQLMPYTSILVFGSFGLALAKRVLTALSLEENLNTILEERVSLATENLAASEKVRNALEVSYAVTAERDRLMREIHDGIGSNLVSAIAAAGIDPARQRAVPTLRRALTDLRIAVDSIEPVEGDVTTLLANLRYRIEPELKVAGLKFKWKVGKVPTLDWLDAVGALHVLRIFQETFSNIAGHSSADEITVTCKVERRKDVDCIRIEVRDNGKGFAPRTQRQGKGLKNMHYRASAIGAQLECHSRRSRGTSVKLWLPIKQSSALRDLNAQQP
jgi:signal transduction histidine kinase